VRRSAPKSPLHQEVPARVATYYLRRGATALWLRRELSRLCRPAHPGLRGSGAAEPVERGTEIADTSEEAKDPGQATARHYNPSPRSERDLRRARAVPSCAGTHQDLFSIPICHSSWRTCRENEGRYNGVSIERRRVNTTCSAGYSAPRPVSDNSVARGNRPSSPLDTQRQVRLQLLLS